MSRASFLLIPARRALVSEFASNAFLGKHLAKTAPARSVAAGWILAECSLGGHLPKTAGWALD